MRCLRLAHFVAPALSTGAALIITLASCVGDEPVAGSGTADASAEEASVIDASPVPRTTVFVDSAKGDDSNDGRSAAKAVRSLKKGLSLAVAGDIVELASGQYGIGNGDDFEPTDSSPMIGYRVPDGITIRTAQAGGATLVGASAPNALTIPNETVGTVKISNIKLTGFESGIVALGGTTELTSVEFDATVRQLVVTGSAKVNGATCTFGGAAANAVFAQGTSVVKLKSASFKGLTESGGGSLSAVALVDSANVELDDATFESNSGGLANISGSGTLLLVDSVVRNNLAGAVPTFSRLVLDGNGGAKPTLKVRGGQIANNAAGAIFANGGGTIDLDGADITNNGEVGIELAGDAALKGRHTKVRNHARTNIVATATDSGGTMLEPRIDFGTKGDSGFNDVTFATVPPAEVFSLDIFTGGGATAKETHSFVGTQFTFNTTQPTGTVSPNDTTLSMAPHYKLTGKGFKVVFSDP